MTICRFVPQVCKATLKEFQQEYLVCPTDPEDWKKIEERFRHRWNVAHAVGAQDGKHIAIKKPKKSGSEYFNYNISTSISYTSLQYQWRVGRMTICKFVPQVCKAILKEFQQEYLVCPTDPEDWKKIEERFRHRWNVAHAVGVQDGKHIAIKKPKKSGSEYFNYNISTSIINGFLAQGTCPNFFKQAHVTPILKKSSLDKEVFKNYKPVSNLNFISKILERVVAAQLQTHLDEASLMTAFQSAYRKHHSTESALLNIHNDILLNMAKGSVTALTLLDLSAVFNTIDHTILLDRLNGYYGISELALGWFKSYLSGGTHSVKVGSTLSNPVALQHGVPQGSVLGPILFSLYTNPISSIIQSHSSINYHFYAHDTQLHISLSPANFSHSGQKLKNCLNDIQNFMFTNKLKLNPDKTGFILIGSKNNRKQLLPHFPINILGNQVQHKVSRTSEWCLTPISLSPTRCHRS